MTPPEAAPADDPARCHACRGTGLLISGEGGTPHPVTCPWCEGSGRFIPGHDAQAARAGGPRQEAPASDGADGSAAADG